MHDAELLHRLDDIHLRHQAPLAAIKLASYAADMLHLHEQLRQNANASPAFDTQLKAICPQWRDPGATSAVDEPITLIAQVLDHGARGLQSLFDELWGVLGAQAPLIDTPVQEN